MLDDELVVALVVVVVVVVDEDVDDLLDDDAALELEVADEAYKTRKLRATIVAMVLI